MAAVARPPRWGSSAAEPHLFADPARAQPAAVPAGGSLVVAAVVLACWRCTTTPGSRSLADRAGPRGDERRRPYLLLVFHRHVYLVTTGETVLSGTPGQQEGTSAGRSSTKITTVLSVVDAAIDEEIGDVMRDLGRSSRGGSSAAYGLAHLQHRLPARGGGAGEARRARGARVPRGARRRDRARCASASPPCRPRRRRRSPPPAASAPSSTPRAAAREFSGRAEAWAREASLTASENARLREQCRGLVAAEGAAAAAAAAAAADDDGAGGGAVRGGAGRRADADDAGDVRGAGGRTRSDCSACTRRSRRWRRRRRASAPAPSAWRQNSTSAAASRAKGPRSSRCARSTSCYGASSRRCSSGCGGRRRRRATTTTRRRVGRRARARRPRGTRRSCGSASVNSRLCSR